jgi:outer membrane immunogenic protein
MARSSGAVAGALLLVLSASSALAQSSIGVPTNAATGRSIQDAAGQNEKAFIDSQVLGDGGSGKAVSPAGGLAAVTAFPTGRLRSSEHDGVSPQAIDRYGFSTHEASAFGNAVVVLPGTVLGGRVTVSGFAGSNWLSVDLKSNSLAILDPNQFGTAENDSIFVGASVLWAKQSTYALATLIGMWGETRLVDSVDNCSPAGCSVDRYKFNTSGIIGSGTVGQVFDLGGASAPKLDLRGTIAYTQHDGDWFKAILDHQQRYTFSTWTGTGAVTLFSNLALQNDALLRPYVQAYVRQEWDYRNQISVIDPAGVFVGTFSAGQSHTYGGLDAGVTYTLGNMTVGAAMYSERSGDERTLGGRLGASWKLGEAAQPAKYRPSVAPLSWTGFYVGANAGFAWSDVDMTDSGPFFTPFGGSDTISAKGGIGGGHVGYNWQLGSIVAGVEAMWSSPLLKDERVGTFFEKEHWIAQVSQLYSVTGRLGLAAGSWMPYVKGGFAGAVIKSSMTAPTDPPSISQAGSRHSGWTVGGGLEYMFAANWIVGVEYNFYYLDGVDVSANRTSVPGIDRWTVTPDNIQTVTARMSLKLN